MEKMVDGVFSFVFLVFLLCQSYTRFLALFLDFIVSVFSADFLLLFDFCLLFPPLAVQASL